MKVTVVREGGFAGLVTTTSLDAADLPETDGEALRSRVAGARDEPQAAPAAPTQPDSFAYQVIVEDDDGEHRSEVREQDAAPGLRDLIAYVEAAPQGHRSVGPPI